MRKDTITRAYKACLTCRKRKVRCDLGESNQPPCQRCRRESRECTVPEERAWNKQTPGRGDSSGAAIDISHQGFSGPSFPRSTPASSPRHPRPQENLQEAHAGIDATTQPGHTSSGDLEDTIIRTAVTSGNDALGLLFRDVRSGHNVPSAGEPTPTQSQRPLTQQQVNDHSRDPFVQASDNVKRAWSSSKLGHMGWLRAHEVVSLLDS